MPREENHSIPNHFYSLDVLRGLAALAVVLFHWRHSFYTGTTNTGFVATTQPFYATLYFFYEEGQKAVELFFTLSGFIFFWLYAKKVNERRIAFFPFIFLRLSRLYPLHFVTLLTVLVLQLVYYSSFSSYFVYAQNDPYHFVLQLFFASNWGFQEGFSFNGPVWSVSVEILLYVAFFLICWLKKDKLPVLFILTMGSYLVFYYKGYQPAQGLFSFFVGGLTYNVFRLKFNTIVLGRWGNILVGIASIAWMGTVLEVHTHYFSQQYVRLLDQLSIHPRYFFLFERGVPLFVGGFLFPLTILALVILETRRGTLGKRLAFVGDISYSSYLWHFPLQLTFVLLANAWGYSRAVFESPVVLLLFFAVLIVMSGLSHRYFEMPMQRKLRRTWLEN
jgi:peptidoglycan/LPS O-acetylase OafA/YrhL